MIKLKHAKRDEGKTLEKTNRLLLHSVGVLKKGSVQVMRFGNIFEFPKRRKEELNGTPPKPEEQIVFDATPIDPLEALGRELEAVGRDFGRNTLAANERDKDVLERYAFSKVDGLYRRFDPQNSQVDRRVIEAIERLVDQRKSLCQDLETADILRRTLELELPPPPPVRHASAVVIATAVLVYAAGSGASLLGLFEDVDDAGIAWILCLAIGAALGALVVWSILQLEEGESS